MITIDATNQSLGRVATQAAKALQGKDLPSYSPQKIDNRQVKINNISQLKFTGKKLEDKTFKHYSGYPGGLKSTNLKDVYQKRPEKLVRQTVYGMLPKNKTRAKIIKNLIIKLND